MTAGKRPAVPEVRLARGGNDTTLRSELGVDHVERVEGRPLPPPWLFGRGLEIWESYTALLEMRGQLSLESFWPLCGLVECTLRWEELRSDIAEKGYTQEVKIYGAKEDDDSAVMERMRPTVGLFMETDRAFRQWLAEFGLTDATRARVPKGRKTVGNNPLSKYGLGRSN